MRSTFSGIALILLLLVCFLMIAFSVPLIVAEDPVVDVAVIDLVPNKRIVGEHRPMEISVTLQNQGDEEVIVDTNIHVNETRIAEITDVTLASGESKTVGISWFAFVEKGNYTLSANVMILVGETDVDDNTRLGGWLFVTRAGDVNGDRWINIFDVVRLAMAYGSYTGDPQYDVYCDFDDDGDVDVFDMVTACDPYGWHW